MSHIETEVINTERLKFFTTFASLSDKQLDYIAVNAQIMTVDQGEIVIELGSSSSDKYLLLDGSVQLQANDASSSLIDAQTERAKTPIAQLRPSSYRVTCVSKCKFLVLHEDFLNTAIEQADIRAMVGITETILDDEHEDDRILYELILELQQGNFVLPSLPSIATKIRETIAYENSSAHDIAKIVMNDPAIATKIIKAANSALYQRKTKAEDCKTAVVGLGTKVTNQLVNSFVLRELFQAKNKLLNRYMAKLWEHSVEIAAISYVLAKVTPGFDAEQAMLAGLIHDIGKIAILNKAEAHPLIMDNEAHLHQMMEKMHNQVGSSILRSWNFSDDMINVAEEAENWVYNENEQPCLVDIINIAHLHSYIGSAKQRSVPIIDQVPAFHKLALGKLTPKLSIKVLEESHKIISETKKLLSF